MKRLCLFIIAGSLLLVNARGSGNPQKKFAYNLLLPADEKNLPHWCSTAQAAGPDISS